MYLIILKFSLILIILILSSCSSQTNVVRADINDDLEIVIIKDTRTNGVESKDTAEMIPADGEYRYAIAFAEWEGKTMGEKVTVVIKGDSITVIYEGDGALTAKKGEVLERGVILKHKSGEWIIAHNKEDEWVDEFGGCTGGPSIIDFKNKRFWLC